MAVNPQIILAAIDAASNEKIRKIVMYVVFFLLGLIILVFITFSSIISGIFSLFQTGVLKSQWSIYENTVSGLFSNYKAELSTDIKKEIIEFMPDFSYNLSKAIISESVDSDELIIFDNDEMSSAQTIMRTKAEEIRKITTEGEAEKYFSGYSIKPTFSEIRQPEFLNDTDIQNIGKYSQSIQDFLYARAKSRNKKYRYDEGTIEINGKQGTRQVLEVWGSDGGLEQRFEYINLGSSIYLPELLAMYNIATTKNNLSDDQIDDQIAEVIGSIPQNPDEYLQFTLDMLKYAVMGDTNNAPSIFKTLSIKSIIEKAGIKNIVQFDIDCPDPQNLKITLRSINSDAWREIFNIDESLMPYVQQTQMSIEMALQSANISQDDWYVAINGIEELNFFEYFGGLFDLSFDNDVNTDITSLYGNISMLHEHNGGGTLEKGLTLQLNKNSEVNIGLQQGCDKFITDVFIYDVWNMSERKTNNESMFYNHSAVTIAYIIDVNKFKSAYGFPFPSIKELDKSSGYVTVFVEISCLENTPFVNKDLGTSVSRNYTYKIDLGNAHNGNVDKNTDSETYSHTEIETGKCERHFSIKVNIRGGKTEKQKPDPKTNEYKGITTSEDLGVTVNPAIWVKGLINDTVSDDIYAIQPK